MDFNKLLDNKLKRNKFFVTAGTGIAGYFLLKTFPLSLFINKRNTKTQTISVKLNPDAVSRENAGVNNVGK
jgi:hypothetical protein